MLVLGRQSNRRLLNIIAIVLIGLGVLASCAEDDPYQGMPGHMVKPPIIRMIGR